MNRPELHDVLRRWRAVSDAEDPPRMLVGETYVLDLDQLMPVLRRGRATSSTSRSTSSSSTPTSTPRSCARSSRASRRCCRRRRGRSAPAPTTTRAGSPTRWAQGDPRRARARAAAPADAARHAVPLLRRRDRAARRPAGPRGRARPRGAPHRRPGATTATSAARRCRGRAGPGGGFTDAGAEPWLPFGDLAAHNVADQREDPDSTLHLDARPDRAAARARRPARRGLRDARRARRRLGVPARRRPRGRAQPLGRRGDGRRARGRGARAAPTARATAQASTARSPRGRASSTSALRPAAADLEHDLEVAVDAASVSATPSPRRALEAQVDARRRPTPAR